LVFGGAKVKQCGFDEHELPSPPKSPAGMANLLLIESATEMCSVAVATDGQLVSLEERRLDNLSDHSRLLSPLIETALSRAAYGFEQLHAVAVSKGPGSYSSLRSGVSLAKGICYALDIPLIGVDTLRSLAHAAAQRVGDPSAAYVPMIDARRMEVYAAVFDAQTNERQAPAPHILTAEWVDALLDVYPSLVVCGNGARKIHHVYQGERVLVLDLVCSAAHLLPIAHEAFVQKKFEDLAYFVPVYLKPPHITTPRKKI
jgi:tRNA threonylcarbamoyladenosine biosynthesis protein TsaB